MNNQDFETLWEMAGAEGRGARMAADYPAWRVRRRQTTGLAAMAVVAALVATPMLLPNHSTDDYLKVYCNNQSATDRQWVDLAGEMLLS